MKRAWAARGDRWASAGAALVIISLFEPWYQWRALFETAQVSLWQADRPTAAALLAIAALTIAVEVWRYLVKVGELRQTRLEAAVLLIAAAGAATLIIHRIRIFPDGLGVTTALVPGELPQKVETVSKTVPVAADWGMWLGLGAAAILCLGALLKLVGSGRGPSH